MLNHIQDTTLPMAAQPELYLCKEEDQDHGQTDITNAPPSGIFEEAADGESDQKNVTTDTERDITKESRSGSGSDHTVCEPDQGNNMFNYNT